MPLQIDPSGIVPAKTSDCSPKERPPHQSTEPQQYYYHPLSDEVWKPDYVRISAPLVPVHSE